MRSLDHWSRRLLSIGAVVVGLSLASLLIPEGSSRLVLYNGTASLPIGFYRRAWSQRVEPGVIVAFRPPVAARALGWTERERLLKHVVALAGVRYCVDASGTYVDGIAYPPPLAESAGRPLPHQQGCAVVPPNHVFVLNNLTRSYDSRYYGPIPEGLITGVFVPLWIFSNSH